MSVIALTPVDLALTASLVVALAALSVPMRLALARPLLIAAVRTTIQLSLIGFVLTALFANARLGWVALLALAMLLVAGREVIARQHRAFTGLWGFGIGTASMFVSSFSVTVLALVVVIGNTPWYEPQYAVPLLGMVLGNTMTGIALALDRATASAYQHRAVIETRLALGHTAAQAIAPLRAEAMRTGLIPMINAMAAAGVVSLPGMMTGQILSGTPPLEAVKYQILIMFMIAAGTGFGTLLAVWVGSRRLFDERERLRLDRLRAAPGRRP